jgi:transposase
MSQMIVGMDLARRTTHTAVAVRGDTRVRTFRVANNAASLDQVVRADAERPTVVMEPTGLMWVAISSYLMESGCTVIRADTKRASDCRKMLRRNVKTDNVDGLALARLPIIAPEPSRPMKQVSADRFSLERLIRLRASLVEEATRAKERVFCELEAYLPDGARCVAGGGGLTALKRLLMREYLDPFRVIARGLHGLRSDIAATGIHVSDDVLQGWVDACAGAASIFEPAARRGACPVDFDIGQEVIGHLLDLLEFHEGKIAELEDRINELASSFSAREALMSIPGIGELTSAYILARIDVRDFANGKKLVGHLGLAGMVSTTGVREASAPLRISKTGDCLMRQYLHLAAETARRVDFQLAAVYDRLSRKHHNVAITAIAGKLVHRIYAVLKRHLNGGAKYVLRDANGASCTQKESRKLVAERFPSKAALARNAKAKKDAAGAPDLDRGSKSSPKDARRRQPQNKPNLTALAVDNP